VLTPVQAIACGLYYADRRFGAGRIDDKTKCVWTRERLRIEFSAIEGGGFAASLKKSGPDPYCPERGKT
jgi:hypothetical protein